MNETEKYVLEHARVEVEHTRSWPTKILAFYVAINAGIITGLVAFSKSSNDICIPNWLKIAITAGMLTLLIWGGSLLMMNHRSYLRYRNVQIRFQRSKETEIKTHFSVPEDWFKDNPVRLVTRMQGWGFYFFIMLFVAMLAIVAIWAV